MALPLWQTVLIAVLTLLLMLGMGASLTLDDLDEVRRQPVPIAVGLGSQFVWMPAVAWFAAVQLALPDAYAVGLILMACTGGGNASNMLTWLGDADIALSLAMTTVSTLASVLWMPLLLSWWAGPLVAGTALAIPASSVAVTMALMVVPVPAGMMLRRRRPDRADAVVRWGKRAGAALLFVLVVGSLPDHLASIRTAPPGVLLAAGAVCGTGMALGGLGAALARLGPSQRLTVALETGVQNLPVALAILAASFPAESQADLQRVPLLYSATALVLGSLVVGHHRLSAR
jgi:BASS family bile acid:Na+ symporter